MSNVQKLLDRETKRITEEAKDEVSGFYKHNLLDLDAVCTQNGIKLLEGRFENENQSGVLIKEGDEISFIADNSISATVCGEREVEYGGQTWKLSPLTYKIFDDKGQLNASGAYQGADCWQLNGKRLKELPDKQ